MKIKNPFCILLSVATCLAACAAQAQTSTIVADTFGPNESYSLNAGPAIGNVSTFLGYDELANAFTPNGTFYLDSIDTAFGQVGNTSIPGCGALTLSLQASGTDGLPDGASLATASIYVTQPLLYGQVLMTPFSQHPLLSQGQTYWIVAAPGSDTTTVTWIYSANQNNGPTAYNVGNGWLPLISQGAFRVYGTPAAVPEASTTVSFGLLLTMGIGGGVIAAKKKKAATSS